MKKKKEAKENELKMIVKCGRNNLDMISYH